jgi:catechol 2,3-dioxygenase-like lactoylglutathione lyase family enzyme
METRINMITLGVADLRRSIRFYRDGLRFRTEAKDTDDIAFFAATGSLLGLYPLDKLAEDIGPHVKPRKGFSGITLIHNVRTKKEVAETLAFAEKAGAKIEKPAQDTFWGGHSGYFSDPDGYYWEVAWAPNFKLDESGMLEM